MTILIIGAAGNIGTALRREFGAAGLRLRLVDIRPVESPAGNEEVAEGSLGDLSSLVAAMRGVSAVVNLAGCVTDAGIEEQIDGNVRGAFNVYEAARLAGVERVVYASTHHVVGYHSRGRRIGAETILRPDSRYGLTKAFGEQAGAFYADRYGLRVLCIRIGFANDRPIDRRRLSIWTSWRDLAQLVRIGIEHPGLRYAIVYGVSANTRGFFDNETAFALGYKPQDDAEDFAATVLAETPPEDPARVGSKIVGGTLGENEFTGNSARLDEW